MVTWYIDWYTGSGTEYFRETGTADTLPQAIEARQKSYIEQHATRNIRAAGIL
jgi:hypothetical protein